MPSFRKYKKALLKKYSPEDGRFYQSFRKEEQRIVRSRRRTGGAAAPKVGRRRNPTHFRVGQRVIWKGSYGDPQIPAKIVGVVPRNSPERIHGAYRVVTDKGTGPYLLHAEELKPAGRSNPPKGWIPVKAVKIERRDGMVKVHLRKR